MHWEKLGHDLRYALRTFRREPGFFAAAVLIIGLGIASNVAIFSAVNTLLLRPLQFAGPDRLVWVSNVADSARVLILNDKAARRLWPGQNPIGQIAVLDGERRVVGIVRTVRHQAIEQEGDLEAYIPLTQNVNVDSVELVVPDPRASGIYRSRHPRGFARNRAVVADGAVPGTG